MYSQELEDLIEGIIADGQFSDKERSVVRRRAEQNGLDPDEIEIIIEGKIAKLAKVKEDTIPNSIPPIPVNKINNTQSENNLRSLKYGNIRKCPNCGASVSPATVKCSVCQHEFINVETIHSVTKFSEIINDIEHKYPRNESEKEGGISSRASAQITAISNFPIPNTREDLLEFIIFSESRFLNFPNSTESDVAILKSYKSKYIEAVEKAQIFFNNDPQFIPIFLRFDKNKKPKWREKNPKTRQVIVGVSAYLGFLALIGLLIIICGG